MRSWKALGLALVAALALSAMAASAASADPDAVVTGGPNVHGEDTESLAELTGGSGGPGIKCSTATYDGEAEGSTITVGLTFHGCLAGGVAPATVTDNGCHYTIALGTLDEDTAPATAALDCPPNQKVVVHTYTGVPHSPSNSNCTIEIVPQGNLQGLHVTDETNGHLLIEGEVPGVTNYLEGHCATTASGGLAHTINPGNATLHASITLGATDPETEPGLGLE